jgi:hypothetical protein
VTNAMCAKYLQLNANTARNADTDSQRRKDHLGHFVLRLAFCRSWVVSFLSPFSMLTHMPGRNCDDDL